MRRMVLILSIILFPLITRADTVVLGNGLSWSQNPNNTRNAPYNPANKITTFENSPANPDNAPGSANRIDFKIAETKFLGFTLSETVGYAVEGKIINLFTDRTDSEPAKRIGYCIRSTSYHPADGSPNRTLRQNLDAAPAKTELKFDPAYISCRLYPSAEQVVPTFISNR